MTNGILGPLLLVIYMNALDVDIHGMFNTFGDDAKLVVVDDMEGIL